jgi:hypothetical protein
MVRLIREGYVFYTSTGDTYVLGCNDVWRCGRRTVPIRRTLLQTASGAFAYVQATTFLSKREQPEAVRQPETHLWGRAWTSGFMRSANVFDSL